MGTILDCEEMGDGRSAKIGLDGFTREYKRTFRVVTSDASVPALQVALANLGPANRIPRIGEPYAAGLWFDYGAIVVDIDPRQVDNDDPTYWLVQITYRSRSANPARQQEGSGGGSGDSPQNTHPIFARPKATWGTKKVLRPILTDLAGQPIVNSAGTPFDAQTIEVPLQTLTIVRNELQFLPFSTSIYKGRVNSTIFQRTKPGYVLCDDIRHQTAFADGIDYAEVVYEFIFEDDTDPSNLWPWYLNLIDKGPKYRDTETGDVRSWIDPTGTSGGEVLLDGDQGYIHPQFNTLTGVLAANATARLRHFVVRKTIDFNELKLPDPAWF